MDRTLLVTGLVAFCAGLLCVVTQRRPIWRFLALILLVSGVILLIICATGMGLSMAGVTSPGNSRVKQWEHYRNIATVFGVGVAMASFLVVGIRSLMVGEVERLTGTWSKLNEALLKEPMLTEVWLDKGDLDRFCAKVKDEAKRKELYKQRAIAGIIMDSYLKLYLLQRTWFTRLLFGEDCEKPLKEATNDNPTLIRLWHEFKMKTDYERFESFQKFVEKNWFGEEGISGSEEDTTDEPAGKDA